MPALTAGKTAPNFELNTLDGKPFQLGEALARGPVVLAFFKVSCPTCQYAFPLYERLFKAYHNRNVTLLGVSQNDANDTAAFAKEFDVTFPILLDDTRRYPVSNAYGLTNVPTLFWVAADGEIELSTVGWSKPDFEQISRKMAEAERIAPAALYKPGEDILEFRAG